MTPAVQHDFLVRLADRQEIAERTIAFRFEKPTVFVFKPGQFIENAPRRRIRAAIEVAAIGPPFWVGHARAILKTLIPLTIHRAISCDVPRQLWPLAIVATGNL